MAEFTATVHQNEFLPDGGTDVHAIVRVTCRDAGTAGSGTADAAEVIIVDTSGSMGEAGIAQGRHAATAALTEILDAMALSDTWPEELQGSEGARA